MIPDSVFQKGADLHKNFIVCYFNGRAPPFNQIQSVLNHLWGKGRKLEIHNNPLNHSAVVRIQSEYLRGKILEKNIWYVGDSMFHTAQWTAGHTASTPPLRSIKLWAHLTGIPLDLRHQEGLSWVAGLVGDPKETDDFTLNMVSLTLSHVMVELDLTVPCHLLWSSLVKVEKWWKFRLSFPGSPLPALTVMSLDMLFATVSPTPLLLQCSQQTEMQKSQSVLKESQ